MEAEATRETVCTGDTRRAQTESWGHQHLRGKKKKEESAKKIEIEKYIVCMFTYIHINIHLIFCIL